MACNLSISLIDSSEYIGNSLTTINDNFINLKNFLCNDEGDGLYSKIDGLELTAIRIDSGLDELSNLIEAGGSHAWVRFKGTKDEDDQPSTNPNGDFTNRRIVASNNVRAVYRKAIGAYRIYFTTPLPNTFYTISGTSSEKINPSTSQYGWVTSEILGTTFADIKISNSIDPDYVSVIIF